MMYLSFFKLNHKNEAQYGTTKIIGLAWVFSHYSLFTGKKKKMPGFKKHVIIGR